MNDLRECLLIVLGPYLQQNGCPYFGCGIFSFFLFFSFFLSFFLFYFAFMCARVYTDVRTAQLHTHAPPPRPTRLCKICLNTIPCSSKLAKHDTVKSSTLPTRPNSTTDFDSQSINESVTHSVNGSTVYFITQLFNQIVM